MKFHWLHDYGYRVHATERQKLPRRVSYPVTLMALSHGDQCGLKGSDRAHTLPLTRDMVSSFISH